MRKRLVGIGVLSFAVMAAVGCGGDDDGGAPDAAGQADAASQADASTVELHQSGEFLFLEAKINGFPLLGSGHVISMRVTEIADLVAPSYEEAPGSPLGCKAYEFTAAQATNPGIDVGTVQFSIPDGLAYPPCNFIPGLGYGCVSATGTGGDIGVVNAGEGVYSITDPAVTFGADEVGRQVLIQGAGGSNNGAFAIVAVDGEHVIHYRNPGGAAEPDTAGTYTTLVGLGPSELADPVADDDVLSVALTAGGDGAFESFTQDVNIGDAFTLSDASVDTIGAIPLNGSEFAIGCSGEGGECGTAAATALNIETSDADHGELPPFVFLPPATKQVRIFCIALSGEVTVPAEAAAFLTDSGATRIRTTFARAEQFEVRQDEARVNLIAGHAIGGFTIVE